MFTSKLNTSKLSKGFTLIELLVVIAIIGILSSVVLASMNSARKKSRDSRRMQDLKGLATALELSFDQAGAYPVAATSGGTRIVPTTGTSVLNALVTGSFLSQLQDDPLPTASNYHYISDASGTSYCLGAKMEGTPPTPADTCPTLDITAGSVNYWVGP
jgi:prepilin-type N-terminal cleavage/methylation domain-containing protein